MVGPEDRCFQSGDGQGPGERPLVVVFGWAGAKHRHLDSYTRLYREHGCDTVQYILPTRFIFRHTDQVPEAVSLVADLVAASPRPLALHCLSDTGVMCAQGLEAALASLERPLRPRGIVWDSCPGPRPVVTLPKGFVLCAINWLSRMRDGMSLAEAVSSSGRDFKDLAWDNYLLRLRGRETVISTMDGLWTGHWARDQKLEANELFLYSKSDFYISYRYLESEVIPARRRAAQTEMPGDMLEPTTRRGQADQEVRVWRWDRSPHVGHLRAHPAEYRREVEQFLRSIHFIT